MSYAMQLYVYLWCCRNLLTSIIETLYHDIRPTISGYPHNYGMPSNG